MLPRAVSAGARVRSAIAMLHSATTAVAMTAQSTAPNNSALADAPAAALSPPVTKLQGFEFYDKVLHRAKYFLAPMVDQSELAWRSLSRRYGAQVCYTPMIHARLFSDASNKAYFADNWQTDQHDRPLIAQFCANDPEYLLQAALRIQDQCDAVDLNLGCPQGIAQRGHYGSFLMEEWDLIARMVNTLHTQLRVPVTCKIRVFPDVKKTIQYAKMLEAAGCQLLTVHGRLREQRGHKTGLADWKQIRQVKEALSIPVIANGNILYHEDLARCLEETGADGVMTAEGNLYNPALFSGQYLPSYQLAQEYMAICREVPTSLSAIRGHLFKIFRASLPRHVELRSKLATARSLDDICSVVDALAEKLQEEERMAPPFDITRVTRNSDGHYDIPHFISQPYIRPPYEPPAKISKKKPPVLEANESATPAESQNATSSPSAQSPATTPANTKRLARPDSPAATDKHPGNRHKVKCAHCGNVSSPKCPHLRCKPCCRQRQLKPSVQDEIQTNLSEHSVDEVVLCTVHRPHTAPQA
ncbi:tRNA dihydrouridine synthase [Dimargaris xerosporica]|nr:tRNA dihydrouridine synthase [Dimargaris xerosporica]